MADTTTSNISLTKPEVGASTDTWGTKLNANFDTLDNLFTSGPALLVSKGGTGATSASGARTNLGLGSLAVKSTVETADISDANVTTAKIADANVTAAKLASGAARSNFGAGAVLQVVSVVGGAFSTSSTVNVTTGVSASITPTSASSKVLVLFTSTWNTEASNRSVTLSIYRGATNIAADYGALYSAAGGWTSAGVSINYLDSPATTSSTTYTIYAKEGALAGTVSLNAGSTITLLEIAA